MFVNITSVEINQNTIHNIKYSHVLCIHYSFD